MVRLFDTEGYREYWSHSMRTIQIDRYLEVIDVTDGRVLIR